MHLSPRPSGPFLSRLWIEDDEFDAIATTILHRFELLPDSLRPVNIELPAERLFDRPYEFQRLPAGCLGVTFFGPDRPTHVILDDRLDTFDDTTTNRRCRSTLAHECAHAILHTILYRELWRKNPTGEDAIALLNAHAPAPRCQWWEHQANRLMAALLMPAGLVLDDFEGSEFLTMASSRWPYYERLRIVEDLADRFDVSRTLARLRLGDLFDKALPKIRAARLRDKSYASLALCWPDEHFMHLRAA